MNYAIIDTTQTPNKVQNVIVYDGHSFLELPVGRIIVPAGSFNIGDDWSES